MSHKIIIIMPSRPSQLRFSAESISSELSRPTRDSDSSRSGPRRIRLGRLVSDSAETLNRDCASSTWWPDQHYDQEIKHIKHTTLNTKKHIFSEKSGLEIEPKVALVLLKQIYTNIKYESHTSGDRTGRKITFTIVWGRSCSYMVSSISITERFTVHTLGSRSDGG